MRRYNPPFSLNERNEKMAGFTKENAVRIVTDCAYKYEKELCDKTLLFICHGKHNQTITYEFSFFGRNYLHLTGLKPSYLQINSDSSTTRQLSPNDFYSKCINHSLSTNDFMFAPDGTTQLKLEILPAVITKNLSARMIGTYNASSKIHLYTDKIAGSTSACMGFTKDSSLNIYVPNTIIKEDVRDVVYNYDRVIMTLRKDYGSDIYSEVTFLNRKVDITSLQLPDDLNYIFKLLK